ncbi:MAG: hypothetical protein M0Z52_07380 [Actinomycetota bacterium]|nr:hypothetical protein [Actinomycetota bacterium]
MLSGMVDIGTGESAIWRTVRQMADYARVGAHRTPVIVTAQRIVKDYPDRLDQAKALYRWVKGHVTYVNDPKALNGEHFDMLQDPEFLLTNINIWGKWAGDCDCGATLLAALLMAAGFNAGFRVIGPSGNELKHVYNLIFYRGQVYPMDTIEPDYEFGQEHTYVRKEDVWL